MRKPIDGSKKFETPQEANQVCFVCGGDGYLPDDDTGEPDHPVGGVRCPNCNGTGKANPMREKLHKYLGILMRNWDSYIIGDPVVVIDIDTAADQILALIPIEEAERRVRKEVVDFIEWRFAGGITKDQMTATNTWQAKLKSWGL